MAARAFFRSIRFRLFVTTFAVVAGIVSALLVYLSAEHLASLNRSLEAKASAYGSLLAKETESAIAFDDRETAREVFAATSQDGEVRAIALFKADGDALHAYGDPIEGAPGVADGPASPTLSHLPGAVRVTAPVVSKEGPRGIVVLELSTASVEREKSSVRTVALCAFAVAMAAAALGANYVGRSLARRLDILGKATKSVADGQLDAPPVVDEGKDEIAELAASFNTMQSSLKGHVERMQRSAEEEQARLDRLVRERTLELAERNDEMHLVLDNVSQGLFTVDADGRLLGERSRATGALLGEPERAGTLWELLGGDDPVFTSSVRSAWEQVADGMLPLELVLDQLPSTFWRDERCFRVEYTPILRGDALHRALVIVTDCTSDMASQRARSDQEETLRIFERVASDRRGFLDFVTDASRLVSTVAEAPAIPGPEVKRALHTLKGNSAIMGLERVAHLCHELENEIEEDGELRPSSVHSLEKAWSSVTDKVGGFANGLRTGAVVSPEDLAELAAAVRRGLGRSALIERITRLGLEPSRPHLERLGEHASRLAGRLDKPVFVAIEDADVRLFDADFGPWFSSLVHVVRNAVDHGIESPEERRACGKSPEGSIVFRAKESSTEIVVEIADDGRGIDWRTVSEKAQRVGLPCTSAREAFEVLFHDGFSTRDEVTELSGRGVGLGAVRESCRALGGEASIQSIRGKGTTLTFRFPKPSRPTSIAPPPARKAS
jgi:two-component system chemotaxis sensor kinase CheA